tara:strand:- start:20482 stop:20703 length:222 start_codon:yes stop_codon:yes gene_type:complete
MDVIEGKWVELGLTEKEYRQAVKDWNYGMAMLRWEEVFKAPYPYVLEETGFPYPHKKFTQGKELKDLTNKKRR